MELSFFASKRQKDSINHKFNQCADMPENFMAFVLLAIINYVFFIELL